MKRTIILSFLLLAVSAAISIVLWLNGFPPAEYAEGPVRQIITLPGFWALAGGAMFGLALLGVKVFKKLDRAEEAGRYRAIVFLNIMFGPLVALFAQIKMPLSAYGLIGGQSSELFGYVFVIAVHLFIGNFVVTARPNSIGGLRSPWALASASVWTRTQRFLGRNMIVGALATIPLALFWDADRATWIAIGVFFANVMLAYLYSFLIRDRQPRSPALPE